MEAVQRVGGVGSPGVQHWVKAHIWQQLGASVLLGSTCCRGKCKGSCFQATEMVMIAEPQLQRLE